MHKAEEKLTRIPVVCSLQRDGREVNSVARGSHFGMCPLRKFGKLSDSSFINFHEFYSFS